MKCPHCCEPVAPEAIRCPWCGSAQPAFCALCRAAIAGSERRCPACGAEQPAPVAPPSTTFVWDDRSRPLWRRWALTWKVSHGTPDTFFQIVPVQGGLGSPFRFLMVNLGILVLCNFVLFSLMNAAMGMLLQSSSVASSAAEEFTPLWMLGRTVLQTGGSLGQNLLGLLIWSGVSHLCTRVLLGSPASFERTFRTICFSSAPLAWAWIPCVGPWGAWICLMIFSVRGYHHLHGLSSGRAVAAVLVPLGVMFAGCGCAVAGIVLIIGPLW
jgi:hypothetical protein